MPYANDIGTSSLEMFNLVQASVKAHRGRFTPSAVKEIFHSSNYTVSQKTSHFEFVYVFAKY